MILYKFRRKIRRNIFDNFNYSFVLIKCFFTKSKNKKIFIDITEIEKNRYVYNFIKFFKLNGYTVYIPRDKSLISRLSIKNGEFKYASFILKKDTKIGKPKIDKYTIILDKEMLSNDYFKEKDNQNSYYVPMSQYPILYDDISVIQKNDFLVKRKKTVFMAGNFNPEFYNNISQEGFFEILSRREVFDFIKQQNYYHHLTSFEDLLLFTETEIDSKVLLVDTTKDFRIGLKKIKFVLERFDFFMALPGIDIPQSHNLIEAMEMGCIPIIHKNYADLFFPVLQHDQTAIIYETFEELDTCIKEAFKIKEEEILLLRRNVLEYYEKFLSPKVIVNNVVNNSYNKIFIQAERASLNLLNG